MQFTESNPEAPGPTALILPGADYPVTAPLLYWSQSILLQLGWRVVAGAWDDEDRQAPDAFSAVRRIWQQIDAADTRPSVVIGKSLGSLAAPLCVSESIPGIWLTPLLNVDPLVDALREADGDQLLIGGTADRHWLPERLGEDPDATVFSVAGAGHALRVDGDWLGSLEAQRLVLKRIATHVNALTTRHTLAAAFERVPLGLRRGLVTVTEPSEDWTLVFEAVNDALIRSAPASVVTIEHIGSTAVPGLEAKPILDIGIAVRPGTPLESLDGWLTSAGMLLRGDANDNRPDRMYGFELEPMIRLANVHVLEDGSPGWRRYLAFRDHLRANAVDRREYGRLKRALAVQHPNDRLAYIAGKQDYIVARHDTA